MTRKHKTDTALLVTNIDQYIEGKKDMDNYTFVVTPEGHFYLDNGKRVPRKVFENSYPVIELQSNSINKGRHLDGRHIQ